MKNQYNKSNIFIILLLSRFFFNFEKKIVTFLLVWDAKTKHLIGCKRSSVLSIAFSLLSISVNRPASARGHVDAG